MWHFAFDSDYGWCATCDFTAKKGEPGYCTGNTSKIIILDLKLTNYLK